MSWLDALKSLFTGSQVQPDPGYWVYVRCNRCGELLKTRINVHNDLSLSDEEGYVIHKTLVGSRLCFQRIEVTLTFEQNRQLIGQEAVGGELITLEEYTILQEQREREATEEIEEASEENGEA